MGVRYLVYSKIELLTTLLFLYWDRLGLDPRPTDILSGIDEASNPDLYPLGLGQIVIKD